MKRKIFKTILLAVTVVAVNISCSNDFVERQFAQDVVQAPLSSSSEIKSFVRGAYSTMRNPAYYGRDFMAYGEIRSDEMFSNTGSGYYLNVQNYTMISSDGNARDTYNTIYTVVGKANIVINTDVNSITGTTVDKDQSIYYQGQAYAIRAQAFFDLLRLYGQKYTGGTLGIVTPLKFDPSAKQARSTIAETETQIEKDFTQALALMVSKSAYDAPSNKTELCINAVKALMSRYYLYKGDYPKVRQYVNEIYGKYVVVARDLYQPSFDYTLRGAAPNAIFELEVGTDSSLSTSSYNQMLSANGYANIVVKSPAYASYATNDIRRSLISPLTVGGVAYNFLSYSTRGKYLNRTGADNIKMIRYEEVLLNGAEAELQPGGDPAKALTYYKQILANRLGDVTVSGVTTTVAQQLAAITSVTLDQIKLERRKELLGEGFRQWDQLRWGDTSFVPAGKDLRLLAFPIPRQETDLSGTLVVSNPGYDN